MRIDRSEEDFEECFEEKQRERESEGMDGDDSLPNVIAGCGYQFEYSMVNVLLKSS